MVKADFIPYKLRFNKPAGTSRGVLLEKESWFIRLWNTDDQGKVGTGKRRSVPDSQGKVGIGSTISGSLEKVGIGECSIIPGLSPDDRSAIPGLLDEICELFSSLSPSEILEIARDRCARFPAVFFGLETALKDFESGGRQVPFPSSFTDGTRGIPINGLIWMGNKEEMVTQVARKIEAGYSVLKLKVGAIAFEEELSILRNIRNTFTERDLEIRLDANGAWNPSDAIEKLEELARYEIHSLEQPIPPAHSEKMAELHRGSQVSSGSYEDMARICKESPIPIALDEELINVKSSKPELLRTIQPSYIILKPSLLGGFTASEEWIHAAEGHDIGWWITSALESNIGLNAIAQWTATLNTVMPQGLGTGSLFENNIPSPLEIKGDRLFHKGDGVWDFSNLEI